MNPERLQDLDKVIHERARMGIMSLLSGARELSFTELRDELDLTDGNLSVHLKTLQKAGYVAVTKAYLNRRPRTTCGLTPAGERAFATYLERLDGFVRRARGRGSAGGARGRG